jgi:MraZ protein
MFLSEYRHNFDTKGRITIPADYREYLTDGLILTRGLDKNLMVLTPSDFNIIISQIQAMDITQIRTRQLRRSIFSQAHKSLLDSNGRILIPQHLRDFATLNGEATIVGSLDYFEIWDPTAWEDQQSLESEDLSSMGEMVGITFAKKINDGI